MSFLTELHMKYVDEKTFELDEALVWKDDDTEEVIEIPKGFRTDLASVPRLPIIFFLVGDCARKAAIPHDYLSQTHRRSKPAADWILWKAMRDCTPPIIWWRRFLIYSGVVLFGWIVYYRYKSRHIKFDYASRGIDEMIF